jgi:TRAP-type C4-dicarboxylate transport system permease small subunit
MEKIETIFTAVTRTLDQIGGLIILPAVSVVVIVDVFLRYVFNAPFIWSLEFNEWMLLVIFALAIPECTRQNGHIRMELVVANLPPRVQAVLDTVYVACAIWLFYLLAVHAWEEFLFDYELDRITEYVRLPIWGHHLLILGMCIIMIAYFVLRLLATIMGAREFSRTDATGMED